jgi:hypothetical protein
MNALRSQAGMLVALAATAILAFLFGDAVSDPLIGAMVGTIAFVLVMPIVALAQSPDRLRAD